ncbi:chemotaxis protein CheW [Roseateles amylovorans]|uniref:Chemotaxis protein CheW n=1 Tax=Roseateles amylovorans TaxID=2978473 RepID=A0ABY6AY72_9BURK|nr:chemotaxis protein CheW [Roseateles amylovorans]UXH77349.1 chemotaxis protein CheW [Roseateles amylovorans]
MSLSTQDAPSGAAPSPGSPVGGDVRQQLHQWREAFDRSFAEPRQTGEDGDTMDVLGIRIAGAPFAVNLADLAGLMPAMTPAPYPASAPGLLGLIGHQGQVLPLYDLQALIGLGAAPAMRWWAVTRAAALAIAFEGFDGQWRLTRQDRLQQTDAAGTGLAVRCGGHLRPLIELTGLVARIASAAGAAAVAAVADTAGGSAPPHP